jgi:hypothetical protein
MSLAATVFHGVPRLAGSLFRATKAPTIALLVGWIGVSFILAILLTYSAFKGSSFPLDLVRAGFAHTLITLDPANISRVPPKTLQLYESMSPTRRLLGMRIVIAFYVWGAVLAVFVFWWMHRFLTYVTAYMSSRRT